jgi:glucose 1-dehydrogenase
MLTHMPCTRHISIEKIDNMVEFLASDKANYVARRALFVDGGMTLYPTIDFTFHPGEK